MAIRCTSPGAGGAISGSNGRSQTSAISPAELEDACLDARADVEGADRARVGRREERLDDVADVDVVAGLMAVAEHPRRAAARAGRRRRSRRRPPRRAGPGAARRRCRAAARRSERPWSRAYSDEVALRGVLALPVGRVGAAVGGLVERQVALLPLAVDRAAGRGEDEAPGPGPPRGLEQVERARRRSRPRSKTGSATERRTSIWAARWKTALGAPLCEQLGRPRRRR